jgi:hypothetical protein
MAERSTKGQTTGRSFLVKRAFLYAADAKSPDHPKADEAKDILALFLDEDFGTDWGKWQEKMTVWLKDNPD